jgi:polyhydroxyalkanoate synthesis repressor PhaR
MAGDKPNGTVIKKYANRRLYHTGTSAYVTLDDLADMVHRGENFVVQDAKTGEDITRGVLAQIIFDAESRGAGLLPLAFLRQLITFYGGHMQGIVPTYLEHSLASFAREQEKIGRQMGESGREALAVVEDQVRRNMEYFQRSIRMLMPFAPEPGSGAAAAPPTAQDPLAKDVAALRAELARMQERIDALAPPAAPVPPAPVPPSDRSDHHAAAVEDDEDGAFFVAPAPVRRKGEA